MHILIQNIYVGEGGISWTTKVDVEYPISFLSSLGHITIEIGTQIHWHINIIPSNDKSVSKLLTIFVIFIMLKLEYRGYIPKCNSIFLSAKAQGDTHDKSDI